MASFWRRLALGASVDAPGHTTRAGGARYRGPPRRERGLRATSRRAGEDGLSQGLEPIRDSRDGSNRRCRRGSRGRSSTRRTWARGETWCTTADACSKHSPLHPPAQSARRRPPRCLRWWAAPEIGTIATPGSGRPVHDPGALWVAACPDEANRVLRLRPPPRPARSTGAATPDHVWHRRRTGPDQAGAAALGGLATVCPGSGRQRRLEPAPA